MRRSANKLKEAIPNSKLTVIPDMEHREISLLQPKRYVAIISELFRKQ